MIKFNQNTRLKKQIDVNKDQRKKVKKKDFEKSFFKSMMEKMENIYEVIWIQAVSLCT